MNERENLVQLNVLGYLNDMNRVERYEWENYEIPPLEKLETMIEVVRRGLDVDKSDKPGVEKDLIALELVSDEAQGIMNRSWSAALGTALLSLAGSVILFSNGLKEPGILFYPQLLCIGLPAIAIGFGFIGKVLSEGIIFQPMAERFVNKKVKF